MPDEGYKPEAVTEECFQAEVLLQIGLVLLCIYFIFGFGIYQGDSLIKFNLGVRFRGLTEKNAIFKPFLLKYWDRK